MQPVERTTIRLDHPQAERFRRHITGATLTRTVIPDAEIHILLTHDRFTIEAYGDSHAIDIQAI